MASMMQIQRPQGPTGAEIYERKELNKKKTKKEGNGKTLNEEDAARLHELKSKNQQFKRDMLEFDEYLLAANAAKKSAMVIRLQTALRRFISKMRFVRLQSKKVISDLHQSVAQLISLGYDEISITTLIALQSTTFVQVSELQNKLNGDDKPLKKKKLDRATQIKNLGLPQQDNNQLLYHSVEQVTVLVMGERSKQAVSQSKQAPAAEDAGINH